MSAFTDWDSFHRGMEIVILRILATLLSYYLHSDWFAFAYIWGQERKGQCQFAFRFISSNCKYERYLSPHLYFNMICFVILSFLCIKQQTPFFNSISTTTSNCRLFGTCLELESDLRGLNEAAHKCPARSNRGGPFTLEETESLSGLSKFMHPINTTGLNNQGTFFYLGW